MTTKSSKNGTITLSRTNFSAYVGHVTQLNTYHFKPFSSIGLRLELYEIRNSLMKYASNVHIDNSQTSQQKRDNE